MNRQGKRKATTLPKVTQEGTSIAEIEMQEFWLSELPLGACGVPNPVIKFDILCFNTATNFFNFFFRCEKANSTSDHEKHRLNRFDRLRQDGAFSLF